MRALLARVLRTIRRRRLFGPDDRIAVAISGGPDSVALTWMMHGLEVERGATVAGLIHVNHRLRAESDEDESFCRALAARLNLPIEVARVDVVVRVRAQGRSIEVAARDVRYAFFDDAATRLGATVVATGHTLDDQAETVLMRLVRGAGSQGLSGVRARRGRIVRPLLDCRRADLRRYLAARGEAFREDPSNADVSIPRNRVRHELVPVLERMAPGSIRALARVAELAADDDAWLTEAAVEHWAAVVVSEEGPGGPLTLDAEALGVLPAALSRRLIRRLAARTARGAIWSARHVEAVRELASADKPGGHLDLPEVSAERQGRLITLGPAGRTSQASGAAELAKSWPERRLDVPGEVEVPEAALTLAASRGEGLALPGAAHDTRAMIQAAAVSLPLTVRNRRPGDRLRPLGAPGRRKLQDVLVDRKVSRERRDDVPIVADAAGRIVWVAGVVLAEECRVTAPERGVVILEVRKHR